MGDLGAPKHQTTCIQNQQHLRLMNINHIIPGITEVLKKQGVEKAILFGSYAYGHPSEESDIDLLAIKNIPECDVRNFRIELKKELWKKFNNENCAFDVIVDSEDRVKNRIALGDRFYDEILNKGKVLYGQ